MAVSFDDARLWMVEAAALAEQAATEDEVPVGALVLQGGRILATGYNRTIALCDPTAHAEILALRRAAQIIRNFRIRDGILVTTLEPCCMCFGAMLEARVSTLIYAVRDPRRGAVRTWEQDWKTRIPAVNLDIVQGIYETQCRALLKEYFRDKR